MDHVVYLDAKANEFEKIAANEKSMIIRGATGRKLPHGRLHENDVLYFINNNDEGLVKGRARVDSVFNSERMTAEQSEQLVREHQDKLQLTDKQFQKWAGKRYIVLINIADFETVPEFKIDKSEYGNMDDWLPVGDVEKVKIR
jgi:hypothetical protein